MHTLAAEQQASCQANQSRMNRMEPLAKRLPRFAVVDVNLRRGSTHVTGTLALWILYVEAAIARGSCACALV